VSRASVKVVGLNRVTVDTGRGHRAQVLDFDAVWNEEASSRDIYESTAKAFIPLLILRDRNVHIAQLLLMGSLKQFTTAVKGRGTSSVVLLTTSLTESQASEVCRIHDTEEMVLLDGLREVEVSSAQELLRVYCRGTAHRNAGVSKGDFASKSHMVFSVTVIHTRGHSDNEGVFIASKLTLILQVQLNATAPGIRRGFRVAPENPQEAKTLKRSLTIFRNVPDVWTTEKSSTHLPRAQGCPPITTDRRSQSTLLPILANPGPLQPPGSKSRSGSSVVALGGSFFPYLQQLNGHLGHAVGFMDG
ncbi:hypothetical protein P4O66_011462, partial [Electrophorus voltai]